MATLLHALEECATVEELVDHEVMRTWEPVVRTAGLVRLRSGGGVWVTISSTSGDLRARQAPRLEVVHHGGPSEELDRMYWYAFTATDRERIAARAGPGMPAGRFRSELAPYEAMTASLTATLGWNWVFRVPNSGALALLTDADLAIVESSVYVGRQAAEAIAGAWPGFGPRPERVGSWLEAALLAHRTRGRNVRIRWLGPACGVVLSYGSSPAPATVSATVTSEDRGMSSRSDASWVTNVVSLPGAGLGVVELTAIARTVADGEWFPGSGAESEESRRRLAAIVARTALERFPSGAEQVSEPYELSNRRRLDGPPIVTVSRREVERIVESLSRPFRGER